MSDPQAVVLPGSLFLTKFRDKIMGMAALPVWPDTPDKDVATVIALEDIPKVVTAMINTVNTMKTCLGVRQNQAWDC